MGAIPALVISATAINIGARGDQGVAQRAGPIKNSTDPAACAMKYLQALLVFSDTGPKGWKVVSGIKERRFISIPNHAISQLGAVRDVIVPRTRERENKIEEIGIIKEEMFLWWGLKSQAICLPPL